MDNAEFELIAVGVAGLTLREVDICEALVETAGAEMLLENVEENKTRNEGRRVVDEKCYMRDNRGVFEEWDAENFA